MTAPVPLRLRPLEIGDLLDETFRVYRRHFLLFAGISVILSIPQAALSGYGYFALLGSVSDQATTGGPINVGQFESSIIALGFGLLVVLALSPFLYGAVTYAACESAVGRPVTPGQIVSAVRRKYFPLLGYIGLIYVMWIFLWCVFPLPTWITVGLVAVMPIMFVENASLGAAMSRSWHLVQGRWWRTFLVLFLIVVVYYVASLALSAFISLAQTLAQLVTGPVIVAAIASATSEVVQSLVTPVLQIVIVLIYFDLRVRREGLDLFQLAQRVSGPPLAT